MVVTQITSGLGNQLFQYAIGRSLALKRRSSLYFDLSYYRFTYDTDTPRVFKLDRFSIDYQVLNTSPYRYLYKASKLLPDRTLRPFFSWIKEPHFHADLSVLTIDSWHIMLVGFWQSENYFAPYADVIRRELTFQREPGPAFHNFKNQIHSIATPISVHIRRGDYVNHPEFSQSFGFVGLDYYERALAELSRQFPTAHYFVFSDDPGWVRENLPLNVPHTFVTNNGPDADVDDLELMSLCHHHVIANSSFSWWGAWLNPRPDKVVITPQNWFRHKPMWDTKDLIPAGWLRL